MGEAMQSLDPAPLILSLSPRQFNHLQELLQQVAQDVGAMVLTEQSVPQQVASEMGLVQFMVVVSEQFSALLQAGVVSALSPLQAGDAPAGAPTFSVNVSFVPGEISSFLERLLLGLPAVDPLRRSLVQAATQPRSNQAALQSAFTSRLIAALTATPANQAGLMAGAQQSLSPVPSHLALPAPSSPADNLYQQVEQERLLNQVITQIRQSLELPAILQTTVDRVRVLLEVDRLVIYQLENPSPSSSPSANTSKQQPPLSNALSSPVLVLSCPSGGSVIYEARASEQIPSVLRLSEAHCFDKMSKKWDFKELVLAVEDVEVQYASTPCLLNFLRQAQVKAKLVAPIVIRNQLWGLLIAHQCHQARQWQDREQTFLQQIAEHLSLAISQAQLYAELQQQKHTLEQRVIERTQELHDVMQAAQAANRAKSEFLASISHELRTPLTCIIGMSATLQRWSKDVLSDRQYHFLQTIYDSGEYLLALINDILDLSQAEAGKMMLDLSEFSLSRLAQQTLKAFEERTSLREVEIELDLRIPANHDRFVADARRIQQILFNLLDNAIKFTSAPGKVMLRVLVEENLAIFQVKDEGIGIAEEQLPLLFQKFHQLNAGYQRQYRGTGLGLALTKQLVELHGGWIDVESTVGVGSIFTVHLPMQQLGANNSALQARTAPIPGLVKGRIVLIEHDEEDADLICGVLTAAGYQVVWMLEGSTAVDQVEVLQPILIITNVQLPDIDGYHLIRRLRQNPATKHLKLIAITPGSLEQDATDQVEAFWAETGANDSLAQPLRADRLLQKVIALTR